MDKFLKSLERLATARGIVALLIILLVAFFVYKNLDFISEVTFKVNHPTRPSEPAADARPRVQETGKATFDIREVRLSPVDFALPAFFYTELRNTGLGPGGVEVLVDFGQASVDSFEIRPAGGFTVISGGNRQNTIKVQFHSVAQDESVYLYALLTIPTFRELVANPIGKGGTQRRLTYDGYVSRFRSGWLSPAFRTFLEVVVGTFIAVMVIYFTYVLITKLNTLFRMPKD